MAEFSENKPNFQHKPDSEPPESVFSAVDMYAEETSSPQADLADKAQNVSVSSELDSKYFIMPGSNRTPWFKKLFASWRRIFLSLTLALILIFVSLGGVWAYQTIQNTGSLFGENGEEMGFWESVRQVGLLFRNNEEKLDGEEEGQVNVMILGHGGPGHPGANLADTLIVASWDPSRDQAAFLSLPRDLYVPVPIRDNYEYKINEVFHYCEQDNPGAGAKCTRDFLEDFLGIEIPYYVSVNFTGFKEAIDIVGGVEINIENSFTDYQFPADNMIDYRPPQIFEVGTEIMDGDRALVFARSRKGTNGEGSDFRRSARQQQVIWALKDKVLQTKTLLNIKKLADLSETLADNIQTNLSPAEAMTLANKLDGIGTDETINVVAGDSRFYYPGKTELGAYGVFPNNLHDELARFVARNLFRWNDLNAELDLGIDVAYVNEDAQSRDTRKQVSILDGLDFNTVRNIPLDHTVSFDRPVIVNACTNPEDCDALASALAAYYGGSTSLLYPDPQAELIVNGIDSRSTGWDGLVVMGVGQEQ